VGLRKKQNQKAERRGVEKTGPGDRGVDESAIFSSSRKSGLSNVKVQKGDKKVTPTVGGCVNTLLCLFRGGEILGV